MPWGIISKWYSSYIFRLIGTHCVLWSVSHQQLAGSTWKNLYLKNNSSTLALVLVSNTIFYHLTIWNQILHVPYASHWSTVTPILYQLLHVLYASHWSSVTPILYQMLHVLYTSHWSNVTPILYQMLYVLSLAERLTVSFPVILCVCVCVLGSMPSLHCILSLQVVWLVWVFFLIRSAAYWIPLEWFQRSHWVLAELLLVLTGRLRSFQVLFILLSCLQSILMFLFLFYSCKQEGVITLISNK